MIVTLPLNSASSRLLWSNVVYVAGAALTLVAVALVFIEKRLIAAGIREKTMLITEWVAIGAAIISLVGTVGAVHYGNVVSHLRDVDLATYKAGMSLQIAQEERRVADANKAASSANKEAADANVKAGKAVLDKVAILNENLKLKSQIEQERTARMQIEQRLAPRQLTHQQQLILEGQLRKYPPQNAEFVVYQGNPEADFLAGEIRWVIGNLKWKCATVEPIGGSMKGIRIEYAGAEDGVPGQVARDFYTLFRNSNIGFAGPFPNMMPLQKEIGGVVVAGAGPPDPHPTIRIIIGTK